MTVSNELDRLESVGLIKVASVIPELEYLFRHWMIQEAAYSSLLKRERKRLHEFVGNTLVDLYPDRSDEMSAELAHHFEEAGDVERALDYLLQAGEQAGGRGALHEARSMFDRAAKLVPTDDAPEARRKRIRIVLGSVRSGWTFNPPEAELASMEKVLSDAETLGDKRSLVDLYTWITTLRQFQGEAYGTSPELTFAIDKARQISEEISDKMLHAETMANLGMTLAFSGRSRDGAAILEEVLPVMEEKGGSIAYSFGLAALGVAYARLGEFAKAESAAVRAEKAAETGDPIAKLDALLMHGMVHLTKGELSKVVELSTICTRNSDELGAIACAIGSNLVLGTAYLMQGKPEVARRHFERSDELSAVSWKFWKQLTRASLATVDAMTGNIDKAHEGWAAAIEGSIAAHDAIAEAAARMMRANTVMSQTPSGGGEVLADLEKAIEIFERLEMIPDLARALKSYGVALRTTGRQEEGTSALQRSFKLLEKMGLTEEAGAAEAELAAS